jgi:hypothetical protein
MKLPKQNNARNRTAANSSPKHGLLKEFKGFSVQGY